jgi:molybdopterin/thiamine biosynthesis adenylyltransferase
MPQAGDVRYTRQSSLIPLDKLPPRVIFVGVGGLGSNAAERVARIGVSEIVLYDPQTVEEVNLGSQAFLNDAVDKPKVIAAQEKLAVVSEAKVVPVQAKYDGSYLDLPGTVMVVTPDDMDVRAQVFRDYAMYNPNVSLYIEARMAGLWGEIYAINPSDPDQIAVYDTPKILFASKEAVELDCTARGVDFNCDGIAVLIANLIRAHVTTADKSEIPIWQLIDLVNFRMDTKILAEMQKVT